MIDIALDNNGDIAVSEIGDISITESICQAIEIRLKWILNEWRLGPELGFDWFDEVFIKNPNTENIKQLIRSEILQVDGVEDAEVTSADYDTRNRKASFICSVTVQGEIYTKEVEINV